MAAVGQLTPALCLFVYLFALPIYLLLPAGHGLMVALQQPIKSPRSVKRRQIGARPSPLATTKEETKPSAVGGKRSALARLSSSAGPDCRPSHVAFLSFNGWTKSWPTVVPCFKNNNPAGRPAGQPGAAPAQSSSRPSKQNLGWLSLWPAISPSRRSDRPSGCREADNWQAHYF